MLATLVATVGYMPLNGKIRSHIFLLCAFVFRGGNTSAAEKRRLYYLSCVPQAGAGSLVPQAGAGVGSLLPQAGAGSCVPHAVLKNSLAVMFFTSFLFAEKVYHAEKIIAITLLFYYLIIKK